MKTVLHLLMTLFLMPLSSFAEVALNKQISYYDIMGVTRSASLLEIRTKFRSLAMKTHPDLNGAESSEAFRVVAEAYEVLNDPDKRKIYDFLNITVQRAPIVSIGTRITPETLFQKIRSLASSQLTISFALLNSIEREIAQARLSDVELFQFVRKYASTNSTDLEGEAITAIGLNMLVREHGPIGERMFHAFREDWISIRNDQLPKISERVINALQIANIIADKYGIDKKHPHILMNAYKKPPRCAGFLLDVKI